MTKMVTACPDCGNLVAISCWHYHPGLSGTVPAEQMPVEKALALRRGELEDILEQAEDVREQIAQLLAVQNED